jgi:dTDP-4-dehydrorhamnose reductase
MTTIVIGASGMLGLSLCRKIDHDYIPLTREELDITDYPSIKKRCSGADVIYNCSAYTDVEGAESDSGNAFLVNDTGVDNLAKFCSENNCKLVHVSTDFVFDGEKLLPYEEGDDANPIGVYGKSKSAGEKAILSQCDDFIIARTAWLYGLDKTNFIDKVLKRISSGFSMEIVDDQFGSPTFCDDLADMLIALVENDCSGLYHCVNSGGTTWHGFAKKAIELSGMSGERVAPISSKEAVERFNIKVDRPKRSVLNNNKVEKIVGNIRGWEEALEEYINRREL